MGIGMVIIADKKWGNNNRKMQSNWGRNLHNRKNN